MASSLCAMKKLGLFFVLIVFALFAGGIFGKSLQSKEAKRENAVEKIVAAPSATPTPVLLSKPVTLAIPKLGIKTQIEYVGNDAKGNMDVPKNDMHVAWYEPGFLPGAKGNAVLAGHFDKKSGGPAVFYNLNQLQAGDAIVVTDENRKELTFVVMEKHTYPVTHFPVEEVFGSSNEKYLNLITCGGVWDSVKKMYGDRLVVRSVLE